MPVLLEVALLIAASMPSGVEHTLRFAGPGMPGSLIAASMPSGVEHYSD